MVLIAEVWLTREIHSGLDLGRPVAQALEEEFLTVALTYQLNWHLVVELHISCSSRIFSTAGGLKYK